MAEKKTATATASETAPASKKPASGAPIASHQKKSATEAIGEQRKKGGPYTVEQMRATMSTGGGEPIPHGHKWTNERRRLQPRDPETGHFTYNSDAQYGLKYKSHGKGNATPVGMRSFKFHSGIKKGDKIAINDGVWIAIKDMSYEEVRDYFSHFDEESGEYYSYGEYDHSQITGDIIEETKKTHDMKSHKLSSSFIKKRGRVSKEERERMEAGETRLGTFDMSKLGKYSQAEMAQKMQEYLDGFYPSEKITMLDAKITLGKKKENQAFNDEMDAAGWVPGLPFRKGHWRLTPTGISAFTGKPPVASPTGPAPTSSAPSAPSTPPSGGSSGTTTSTPPKAPVGGDRAKKVRDTFGDVSEAKSNPGKYLTEHKAMLTSFQETLKENGVDITLEKIVSTIANMSEDELADLISDEE